MPTRRGALVLLFDELHREINAAQVGRGPALDSLTRLIMLSLLRLCARSLPARQTRHEDLQVFHRFNELIEAHYLEHWPLSRYALGVGVTEARLNDVCRRIADLPSKRLILERLMQEAKRLLLFTGSSANEICYSLGFKDPAYFSRFFPALCAGDAGRVPPTAGGRALTWHFSVFVVRRGKRRCRHDGGSGVTEKCLLQGCACTFQSAQAALFNHRFSKRQVLNNVCSGAAPPTLRENASSRLA